MSSRSKYCLVGVADHLGVLNVGGRLGAAEGPAAFRAQFKRLRGERDLVASVKDLGDVRPPSGDVRDCHEAAAALVANVHQDPDAVSIVVGGGHDHGYSHLLGIQRAFAQRLPGVRVGCLNIDAHLDVRKPKSPEKATSGSPFYLALEAGVLQGDRLIEFGIQSHCNGAELWTYARSKGVEIVPFTSLRGGRAVQAFREALDRLASRSDVIAISFDLDAVLAASAPGVSAPQSEGFTSSEALEILEIAAAQPKVVSLGIFELNPLFDEGEKTAKLAAVAAFRFLESLL